MESSQNFNELSYFVNKEISDLCNDEEFVAKSQDVLCKLSEYTDMQEAENDEIFSQRSLNSFELANRNQFYLNDYDYDDLKIKLIVPDQEESVPPVESFIQQEEPNKVPNSEPNHCDTHCLEADKEDKENKVIYISSTSETSSTRQDKKRKCKSSREVEPQNFLSLKRKDVIFKSIFRMMRRFFWKLLEENTNYDRKEKCINTKHKQLIKYISIGMQTLGFNTFANNMPFYFAAFAYPSDMRKILEESKQQFRTQNEIISQATYIVELVDNWFNRFSKKILNDMLSIPQISFFIHYYLTNVDDFSEYPRSFKSCYDILIKSRDNLGKYSDSSSSRNSRLSAFILKDEFFLFNKSESN